ncbi:MAG: TIGR03985 family CRISPR-associated protein [Leptolyngbyaceae cyanobacterium SM1_4_3]|nr:TIGR03985 family CRISPR-associated protein [Leptolyngbyaceae cyanobacterium SM1_4_3]
MTDAWQEPPSIPLLQWLVRGSLKQNLLQSIRLWVWLHLLYGETGDLTLPHRFSYVDWRDRFFTADHPTNEVQPALHNLTCPCTKATAAWLFHPDLIVTQSQWQAYQHRANGQASIRQQRDRFQQSLSDHDLLPLNFDHLLQTRLFGFTRRTLSKDLHHLVSMGWLTCEGNYFQKVTSWPDHPRAKQRSRHPSGQEFAFFTQPDLTAIADNFSRTFQGHHRFFVHVDYVISQQKLDRVDDWQSLLADIWQQDPIPPIHLQYQAAGETQGCSLIVYPVCIYYYRRGPYLCAYGQVPSADPALNWRNYRLDRILAITPLAWNDAIVPQSLQRQHQKQTLPTPDEIETAMDEAWGFDYYQPSQLLLLRFDREWNDRYIQDTLRHSTFRKIPHREVKTLICHSLKGELQEQLLDLWRNRSPDDAYYQAYYRQNDPNVLQRLRAWRPHIEVFLPWELRQRTIQEILQELKLYND